MNLPKQLKKENLESEVQAVLDKESFELYPDSDVQIPVLKLSKELRSQIFYAKSLGELIFSYDVIEKSLEDELQGLKKIESQNERVSRLLLVSNDASKRFYRELKFLMKHQGPRLMICLLDVDSLLMGNILGFKARKVNAVLMNRKKSVTGVLKSLLST